MNNFNSVTTTYLVAVQQNCWVTKFNNEEFLRLQSLQTFSESSFSVSAHIDAAREFNKDLALRIHKGLLLKGFEEAFIIQKDIEIIRTYSLLTPDKKNKKGKKKGKK